MERTPLRLGLTGGIGSGKSTVAALLQKRGALLVDADAISRASTLPGGSAITAIQDTFGPSFVDEAGGMHRQRMREHVFAHPDARKRLEAIIHPLVAVEIQRQTRASSARCQVFDIPLLVESSHWRVQLDRVMVVDCSEETQIRRVIQRNAWERLAVQAVINSQCPRAKRLAAADVVIFNDGSLIEPLERLVDGLAKRFGL